MTDSPSAPKMKLGFKACQNARCEEPVYYKHEQCKVCGFVQVRPDKAAAAKAEAESAIDRAWADSQNPPAHKPVTVTAAEHTHTQTAQRTEATTTANVDAPTAAASPPSPPTRLVPPADPNAPVAYVVMEDFACQIGDVHVRLKRGRVLTDPTLIARLLSNNCPVRPTASVDNLACCPQCKHIFTPERLALNTGRKGAA